MSDLLDIRTWSILQWVLVVLAAGFIGQFGKSFAQFIIVKVKARRSAAKAPAAPSSVPIGKGDTAPESSYPTRDVINTTGIITDKKALKAILKQQKKAAKAAK